MTASYISIPDALLAIKKPVTATIARLFRDNPIAMFEGHSDAPKVWQQARRYVDFPASGTFEVPPGCTLVYVEVTGGGGGGASGVTSNTQCGGAAGGKAEGWVTVVPGDLIAVTVGNGGTGGTGGSDNSTAGQTSSFGTYMSATGGPRGKTKGTPSGFSEMYAFQLDCRGGVGVGGKYNYAGSAGTVNYNNESGLNFAEGGLGIGALGGNSSPSVSTTPGAGGRTGAWGATGNAGGAGAAGFVRVWY